MLYKENLEPNYIYNNRKLFSQSSSTKDEKPTLLRVYQSD